MKSVQVAALAALLFEGAQAVPMAGHHHGGLLKHAAFHRKRDIVWVTSWEIETVTVMETVTAGQEPATSVAPATYSAPAPTTTTSISAPAAYPTVPSPSETGASSPAPAPVTSSASVYVPPPAPQTTSAAPPPPATTTAAPSSSAAAYTPSSAPAPATTSAPAQSAASTYAPAPTSSSGGDGNYIGAGDATNYSPGMGACGNQWDGTEDIVAISNALFTANLNPANTVNPNDDLACGQMIYIKGVDGTIYPAKVDDRCMGCEGIYDLDMPLSLFNKVTNNGDGRVHNIGWSSTFDFKIPS